MPVLRSGWAAALVVAVSIVSPLRAQHAMHGAAGSHDRSRDSIALMGTALVTQVAPALAGNARTEALLTQPMLMLRGARRAGALRYAVMLNAEHWTMPNGEPVAGIWGEGFIDRRHPHTVLHEVMLTAVRRVAGGTVSVAAGRGIVPFGTDDPMVRPFTKYPANHHYAQVLERLVVSGAVRVADRTSVELATFNGDEPTSSTASPRWSRFGDSFAARITAWPASRLELQASGASVRSPEFASGDGLDQHKWSASGRWSAHRGVVRYLLAEWARTDERYRGRTLAGYGTGLVEAVAGRGRLTLALRAEQTSRPEEERLLDPFRTARPPTDLTIKGITRWRLATAQLSAALPAYRRAHGLAFLEVTHARSTPVLRPVLLDPRFIIGSDVAWHLTAGVRVGVGAMPVRVGRYGAAAGGAMRDVPLTMPHR